MSEEENNNIQAKFAEIFQMMNQPVEKKKPKRKSPDLSEEQRQALRERLAKAREKSALVRKERKNKKEEEPVKKEEPKKEPEKKKEEERKPSTEDMNQALLKQFESIMEKKLEALKATQVKQEPIKMEIKEKVVEKKPEPTPTPKPTLPPKPVSIFPPLRRVGEKPNWKKKPWEY